MSFTRRQFVKGGVTAFTFGVAAPQFLTELALAQSGGSRNLVVVYLNGGNDAIVSYAKNLLWFVPPWTVYVVSMIVGVPRFGFWPAMAGSLTLYMCCVGVVRLMIR